MNNVTLKSMFRGSDIKWVICNFPHLRAYMQAKFIKFSGQRRFLDIELNPIIDKLLLYETSQKERTYKSITIMRSRQTLTMQR